MRSSHAARALALALTAALVGGCDDGDTAVDPPLDARADGAADGAAPDAAPVDAAPDAGPADMALPDMAPDAGPPARFAELDRCLGDIVAGSGATGAAVAVVEHGALVHTAGIGHKNDPAQTPVEPETLFRFASVLKGMTALALFTEIEAGAVTPDTAVAEVIPALAAHDDPRWQAVTVHQLLTHQGGFADYLEIQEPGEPDSTLGDMVESAAFAEAAAFMVDPGTFYNYANPNYMLVGRAIERLTGQSYREAMQARVFGPLGMHRTVFRPEDVIADGDYALGAIAGAEPGSVVPVPADDYDSVWARPAGFGWASVLDLASYMQYVIDGSRLGDGDPSAEDPAPWAPPITPETWQTWRAAQIEAESHVLRFDAAHGLLIGQGFFVGQTFHPSVTVGHDGNLPGYTSMMLTAPELELGVVTLINGDFLNGPLNTCLTTFLTTSEDAPAPAPPADRWPDPSTFDDYVGVFDGGPWLGTIVITRDDSGALVLSLPDADAAGIPYDPTIIPFARDVFVVDIYDYQRLLTGFRPAPGEPVEYLRTRYFVGHRVEETPKRARTIDFEPLRRSARRRNLLGEPAPISASPSR